MECLRVEAENSSVFDSEYTTYLVTAEQGDQFVGYAKLPTLQRWGDDGVHGLQLFGRISPQIHFGGLNVRMS